MNENHRYITFGLKPLILLTKTARLKLSSMPRKDRNVAFVLISLLVISIYHVSKFILLRPHSIRGGLIGPFIDNITRGFFKKKKLQELQNSLPTVTYGDEFYWNYEKIKNWKEESQMILDSSCRSRNVSLSGTTTKKIHSKIMAIPPFVIQERYQYSTAIDHRKYYWDQSFYTKITVSDLQMRYQLKNLFFPERKLHQLYKRISTWENKVIFWKICALSWLGGISMPDKTISLEVQHLLSNIENEDESMGHSDESRDPLNCQQPILYAIINDNKAQEKSISMDFLAASPRHPILIVVLNKFITILTEQPNAPVTSQLSNLLYSIIVENQMKENTIQSINLLSEKCVECHKNSSSEACCSIMSEEKVFFNYRKIIEREEENIAIKPGAFSVHVRKDIKEHMLKEKKPIHNQLIKTNCEPSFLCNRCLRYGNYGTFSKCKRYCKKCYLDTICQPRPIDQKIVLDILPNNIIETMTDTQQEEKLIPRIIHQTWFEDLSPHKYPDLVRLQNSWKANKGWEYRFYDDKTARAFIEHHFPSRFLLAYDSVIPGAFKADLFRYFVLLIHGGVYADIDVMLETNLDDFITPEMAFFVPRDVIPFGDEFCLWNGFIGSSPGHPIIVKAIERSINLILNKADMFDMERESCVSSGPDMAFWKLRCEPGLLITGPCSLGISLNEALGYDGLQKINLGWTRLNEDRHLRGFVNGKPGGGDTLILSAQKKDLGALRFTYIDENIVIASTDIGGVVKAPLEPSNAENNLYDVDERNKIKPQLRKHYSASANGQWIYGTKMVYSDFKVTNEEIIFNIKG